MSHPGGLKVALGLVLVGLVFAGAPPGVDAQTTSASVTGSVQDSQSGMLPGATVTLTSRTQGNVLTAVTDEGGRFVFPIVRPDTYSMKVTLQGFKTLERTTVVVNANDKLSAGMLTMQVGNLTEEVSVSSRVTEVQSTSGERAFTLESEALKNMGNNGRLLFGLATLAPGVLSQNTGGSEIGSVGGITVNGQRPNSNNITIDGVSNIDTGDNGGNMATTNVDAVAEFKILTNAYQAEYGRAVGGQMQVVTKSGTQQFRGSGYWFGRRSDWDANTWLNNRESLPKAETSRNDSGYTIGGPVSFPGFNKDKKRLFFFWSQEYQRRSNPAGLHQTRVPTALERQGDFSQSVDSSGNPFPYIRDATTGLPCSAANTSGCFQDGGVLGRIPANRLYAPGINALNIYPTANYTGGSGLNFQSQDPDSPKRREDLLRMDFQATNNWRITGRYMHNNEDILQAYGTTWAGNGSDQLPTPTLFVHPGSNYMLSATGVLNSTTSLELSWGRASNSLNYNLQLDPLFRKNANVSALPLLFPDAAQADYIPWFVFRGGRTNNAGQYQTDRGPFTNENITHDVIANVTKVWGAHASKGGFYYQNSFKPQSIFASFNSQIDFTDNTNNPFDTGFSYANAATGVFNFYQQANKYALPEWRYHNFEWYGQDNWKPNRRLTLDYGLRFYYLTPQWDTTLQASNFLPDQFNQANAAKLYRPVCIGASPCSGDARRGMDPTLIAQGATPTTSNTVDGRFIGRLTPGSDRFNGAFQAGQGINDQLQDGNAFRVSPRLGVVYDLSGKGETILRGGWGIFYDRPQGNQVFDMIANAPGVLNSRLDFGTLQSLTSAGADPNPTLSLNPSAFDFKPPKRHAVEHRDPAQGDVGDHRRPRLRRLHVEGPAPAGADQRPAVRRDVPAAESGSDPRAERGARVIGVAERLPAPVPRLRRHPDVGLQRLLELPRAADVGDASVRSRLLVQRLLGVEQGARHQQHGLRGGRAEPERCRNQTARLLVARLRPSAQHPPELDLPVAKLHEQQGARPADQRVAALGGVSLDERPAVWRRLQHFRDQRPEPDRDRRQPECAHRPDLRSGRRLQQRPVSADQYGVLRAAAAPQRWRRVLALLPALLRRSTTSTCRCRSE